MSSRIVIFICSLLLIATSSLAQFQLPRIDVEAKVTEVVFPGNDKQNYSLRALETSNYYLAAHVQINQHIAVGWFYSASMRGNGFNSPHDFKFNFGSGDTKALTFFTGPDIRFSAGRAPNLRPYLSINYCKAQIVEDKGSYRLAADLTAIGANFGLMKKLGSKLYWNIIEIGGRALSKKVYWAQSSFLLETKMGFTYNIGKRK